MAKKKVAEKWSINDRVSVPVEFIITAIGGKEGEEEAALVPVDAHVNHLHMKVSDLPG